jgi:hypothetical protein
LKNFHFAPADFVVEWINRRGISPNGVSERIRQRRRSSGRAVRNRAIIVSLSLIISCLGTAHLPVAITDVQPVFTVAGSRAGGDNDNPARLSLLAWLPLTSA